MDNPIKKKSLIPRMFRAFTLYFFVTLAVFFGYIELFGGVKNITGILPESAQGEVDMTFSNFVSNMMSMKNIYVEGLEFEFAGGGSAITINADVAVDMETTSVSADAQLNVNGHVYNVGVVYNDPEVYLSIDEKIYRFVTTNVGADLDLSGLTRLFEEVSKVLNIDFSGLQKLQDALGIDFANFSMDTLLDQLDISTTKSEGMAKISIVALNHVDALIVCDENGVMESATVKGINLGANALNINVPTVEMNSTKISDRIKTPDTENVIDLAPINDYVGYAENLFANDYVEVELSVDVSGKSYDAKLNIDNSDQTKFKISTEVEGYEVSVVYANETIFVNVDDYGVSIAAADLVVWKDRILEIVAANIPDDVRDLLEELLDEYINVETGKDIAEKIQDYLNNLISSSENFSVVLPSEAVISDDKYALIWDNGLTIELENQDGVLSGLRVTLEDKTVANAYFKVSDVAVVVPTGCEDLSAILAKVDNLMTYIEKGIFEFDFTASYNGFEFGGKFKYANGVFEISGMNIDGEVATIRVDGEYVYFTYGTLKAKLAIPENNDSIEFAQFKEKIEKFVAEQFGVEVDLDDANKLLALIAGYTEGWDENVAFALTGNQDDITLTVSDKTDLSTILTANITFAGDKFDMVKIFVLDIVTAQITVDYVEESSIEAIDPDDYKDYTDDVNALVAKVENLIDYIKAGIFEFDFTASYNGFEFAGRFKYADGVIEIDIADVFAAGELATILATIRIEDGFVYFSYENMKLKFAVPENKGTFEYNQFKQTLSKLLYDEFGVDIDFGVFEELLDMLVNYTEEDWENNLKVSLSGDQDDLTLTVSNKTEKGLSKILTANVTFEENKIATAKVSVYDILIATIDKVYTESSIEPFDPDKYENYNDDFIAGALDSLEIVPNAYGFSSDVAIRYSKTTFYGEITALVVKDETNPAAIGGFVPALSIHTTSLGLNSYIYLIGQTVYLDINGLQIYADLNETTIDEILAFVENKFGIALGGEGEAVAVAADMFKVILPAIDKIYFSWLNASETENGLQMEIEGGLWYGEQSRFEDIILQAFVTNYNNIIIPTRFVIGANIYDPNTLVYDDYSDAWLNYVGADGSKVIIEDVITQNLNFGAYFNNLSVGIFAESIDKVFAIEDRDYQNITSVMSNYGTTALEDFNSYQTVLTMAESVYDYITSLQYQINLGASIVDETSQMSLGGKVVVSVADLAEGQQAQLDLFDGKSLRVQGNLDLNNNGTQHLIDLLYSNVNEGLYLTYSHGALIGKKAFKAKIANANMSEIISMIVKFANLDLGEGTLEAWNIDYCTTDFSYIQSLLGIGETELGDEISKADSALNSVEGFTKMLGLIKLDKTAGEDGLNTITLSVQLKLDENSAPAVATIVLKEEVVGDVIVTKLRQISVSNLVFGGKTISATINIEDFSESSFDYNTTAKHVDYSNISKLIDTLVTTVNTKNFTFNGDMSLNLLGGVGVKIDMTFDLYISIEDINNPYIFAQVMINNSSGLVDVFNGDFDTRMVTYEYKDEWLTFHRYSRKENAYDESWLNPWKNYYTKVTEDNVGTNSYYKTDIVPNIKPIVLNSLGIKEKLLGGIINVPNLITTIINSIDVHPTIEEAIKDFKTYEDPEDEDCENYVLSINGSNVLGDGVQDFDLNIGATKYSGWTYDDQGNVVDKAYSCLDKITGLALKLTGVNIALNMYSNNDVYSYNTTAFTLKKSYSDNSGGTCGGKLLHTNKYYRMKYIDTVGGLY